MIGIHTSSGCTRIVDRRRIEMIDNDDEEEVHISRWSPEPKCSCTGEGKEVLFDGEMVIFKSPYCRVHAATLSHTETPQSVETILGNFGGREKITK